MRILLAILMAFTLAACNTPQSTSLSTSSADGAAAAQAEGEALEARADQFVRAMKRGNWKTVTEIIPPRLIQSLAEEAGVSLAEMRKEMIETLEFAMSLTEAKFSNLKFDFEGVGIQQVTATVDGKEQTFLWAFAPYSGKVSLSLAGDTVTENLNEHVWAVKDEGKWYMVRVAEPSQIKQIREVYPFMKRVLFPS